MTSRIVLSKNPVIKLKSKLKMCFTANDKTGKLHDIWPCNASRHSAKEQTKSPKVIHSTARYLVLAFAFNIFLNTKQDLLFVYVMQYVQ